MDESGFDEFLYREYGRSKKGEKIMAEVSGRKFERQSVVAAKCGNEILAPFGYSGTCNAELFNFWLEKQLVPCLKPKQIVIMDNASIHKSGTTLDVLKKAGCELMFLPPYSPDLNPIEHVWASAKRNLQNNMSKFPSLHAALNEYFS